MRQKWIAAGMVLAIGMLVRGARGTDRYFNDITEESASHRYRVEAKSPDNRKEGFKSFQASFVYTCVDLQTKKVLWTRKQPMGKPEKDSTYGDRLEGSPSALFVSDSGWTVICTEHDELICVDITGHERKPIGILTEGLTKKEQERYVHQTTAGPMWAGYSQWYFLEGQKLFVIRPWWGRRMIVDLERGKLTRQTKTIADAALAYEKNYVMVELKKGIEAMKQRGKEEPDMCAYRDSAYLAGRLQMKEAIPLLETLQESEHIGSSTSGGLGYGEEFNGEVNPHSYSIFSMRQVAALSLRRVGKIPRPLPVTEFKVEGDEKRRPYVPKRPVIAREKQAERVKGGMKAEEVLDLVGPPDFVGYDTWEYDMDAKSPFSLIVKWDARKVIDIHQKKPALWGKGFVRDKQIMW